MIINKTCKLFLRDLYLYDIESCFPKILQSINYDFKGTDLANKSERNIFIGKEQKDNESLSAFLTESVNNLIEFYLKENNVTDEQLIVTQKDGIIVSKLLSNTNEFVELKFRGTIDFLIISIDRNSFLYSSDEKIYIKGVANTYEAIDNIYQKFFHLDFYNKKKIFLQMESLKEEILNNQNIETFMIPYDKKYVVRTFNGDVLISDKNMVDIKIVDKMRYFNHYLKPFLDSLFIAFY